MAFLIENKAPDNRNERTTRIVPMPIAPCLVRVSVAIIMPNVDAKIQTRGIVAISVPESLIPNSGNISAVMGMLKQMRMAALKIMC